MKNMIDYINTDISFGQKIKYLRTMRKMKQFELAEGICSVSYLSKVENDTITPSDEIKELLLAKLNVSSDIIDFDQRFYKVLNHWQSLISEKNLEEADKLYEELLSLSGPFIKKDLLLKFKVFTINYFVVKREFLKAEQLINEIKDIESDLSLEIKYYFHRYIGEFYYYQYNFEDALKHLSESEKLLPTQMIEKSEIAQLYYSLAFSSCKVDKFHSSISYGKKALELFTSIYNLKRCVECHILLGIASRRISNFEESLEHYEKAKTLAQSINFKQILYTINHNIGQLYSFLGNSEQAFKYYMECYKNNMEIYPEHRIETMLAIVEELYKLGNYSKVEEWVVKGIDFAEAYIKNKDHYIAVFQLYENLCKKNFENVISNLNTKIIPFFEEHQKLIELSEILKIIADHEYNNSKYKTAAIYYSMSRDYLMKSIKMN
jgi:HTH-type transcriptional regulator, quorum sensing regulator NprR